MADKQERSLLSKTVSAIMNGTSAYRYQIDLTVTETYVDRINNTSNIEYVFTATKTGGTGYFDGSAVNPVKVIINEQLVCNKNITYDFTGSVPKTIELARGTVTGIKHNNNGTKNLSFRASFDVIDNRVGSGLVSGDMNLTIIPRESSVGVSDTYIDSTATIVINKNDDSFTHTLKYSFEGLTDTIVTKTSQSVYTWTVPTSFYEKIPNSKSGVCTITCQTYNGDILIGTSTTTFRVMVNEESNKPIVSAVLEDVNPTTLALTGDKNTIIKYLSNVKTVITAISKNSATIKSYKVSCSDGKIATESTSTLNGVESNKFSISSTDSRGFTTTIEKTLTMIDYIRLAFTEAVITRPETTSTTLNFNCRGNWFNGEFSNTNSNMLALKFRFKENNGEYGEYQDLTISTNNNTFSFNGALGTSFDYRKQYDFEFVLSDKAMSTIIIFNVESGQAIVRVAEHYVRIAGDLKVIGDLYINNKNIFDLIYPIGSIYISIKNTNPSTLFGGTWVSWGAGRVPVGVDTTQNEFKTVEKTGGEKTHKLTVSEMPKHTHRFKAWAYGYNRTGGTSYLPDQSMEYDNYDDVGNHIQEAGGDQPHNNLQPYITCYMWKRTA